MMSSSSTRATYGGSNAQRTGVKPEKVQNSPRVPVDLTYNTSRFAQESGEKSGSGYLRSTLEFRRAEAQAESEARMQAQLREFDKSYKSSSSSNKGTSAKK